MAGVWERVCRDRHCRCAVVTSGCVDEGSSAGIFSLRTLSVVSLLIKLSRSLAVCFVESSLPHRRRLPAMSLLRLCFFEVIFHFRVLYKYTLYIYINELFYIYYTRRLHVILYMWTGWQARGPGPSAWHTAPACPGLEGCCVPSCNPSFLYHSLVQCWSHHIPTITKLD